MNNLNLGLLPLLMALSASLPTRRLPQGSCKGKELAVAHLEGIR